MLLFLHVVDELSSEFGSKDPSIPKSAKPAASAMPCDILVTASKISCAIYSVVESSALPLLHATIIQPSFRWSTSSHAIELKLNCYNCSVHAGQSDYHMGSEDPSALDSPSCFPQAVVTTRPGKRNSSGILPSLLYLTVTTPEDDSAIVECKVARPVFADIRLELVVRMLEFVQLFGLTGSSKTSSVGHRPSVLSLAAQTHADRPVYPTVIVSTLHMSVSLSVAGSSVCASLSSLSASFYGGSSSDTGHGGTASLHTLSVKLNHDAQPVYLLLPVDVTANAEIAEVERTGVSSVTTAFVKIGLSPVVVKLGTLHHQCFEAIRNSTAASQLTSLMSLLSNTNGKRESSPVSLQDSVRWESEDDIRSGALEYVIQMSEVDRHPQAGQIVFSSGVGGRQPAMSWCYHEPRALSALQALPLPMSAANEVSFDLETDEVRCCLRYYDVAKQSYVNFLHFSLSQIEIVDVELPENTVAAHEWQVIVDNSCDVDDNTFDNMRDMHVSPMALAGCLKINSYFSTSLVPSVNIILEAGRLDVKLMNYISKPGQLTRDDSSFAFDGVLPWEHQVACIRLDDTKVHGKLWLASLRQNVVIQMDTRMQVDYVDFSCLRWRPFLSPFDVHLHYTLKPVSPSSTSSSSHRDVGTEVTVGVEALVVHLSQSLLHTAGRLLLAWQKCDTSDAVVMTQYFICNNTIESLEFGQADLTELIRLESGCCHAFCWRTESSHLLRVRIAADQVYHWSQPFSVEARTTLVIEVPVETRRSVTMVATVHLDGPIRTVVFTGKLQLVNELLCALELRIQTDRDDAKERVVKLQGQKKALSVLENGTVELSVRQDLGHSLQADWSTPVQIQLSNATVSGTISLPVRIDEDRVVNHHIGFSVVSIPGDVLDDCSLQVCGVFCI